jgi:hypothetical protein
MKTIFLFLALALSACTPFNSGGSGGSCCRYCSVGKPCGDSCISLDKNCNKGPGCACYANGEPQIFIVAADGTVYP